MELSKRRKAFITLATLIGALLAALDFEISMVSVADLSLRGGAQGLVSREEEHA